MYRLDVGDVARDVHPPYGFSFNCHFIAKGKLLVLPSYHQTDSAGPIV
ncbi:MAG TPA: hypothetical protein PKD12_20215 [Nitrospira sp.]|nr:hypothetical protein [Nitrospira sp.]